MKLEQIFSIIYKEIFKNNMLSIFSDKLFGLGFIGEWLAMANKKYFNLGLNVK